MKNHNLFEDFQPREIVVEDRPVLDHAGKPVDESPVDFEELLPACLVVQVLHPAQQRCARADQTILVHCHE